MAACALAFTGAAGGGIRASLQTVDLQPLTVRGSGFEPDERVRLLLSTAGGQRWRVTNAGASGRFTMGFGISVGSCGRFALQAFGSKGSRARLLPLRAAQIDCVSPDRGGPTTHGDSTK